MSSKEILVLGSLHYDIFLESNSIPRTGETIKGKKWYPKLGGKGGNQAIAASNYPVPTKLISAVGTDDFAKYILQELKNKKINTNYIQCLNNFNSGMSVAISDNEGDYGAIIVSGANLQIDTNILNKSEIWKNTEILMIQNEIEEQTNLLAAKKAKEGGVRVFYNAAPAKKFNSELLNYIDIILVNTIEAQDITNIEINSLNDSREASKQLSEKFPIAILSAGDEGVILCEKQKDPIHFKGIKVKVKSTHGAGDTFAGTFCGALVSEKNLHEAINIANKKAAEFISM